MRDLINIICEEQCSHDNEYVSLDDVLDSIQLVPIIVLTGTPLYHGTCYDGFDPTKNEINYPAWFAIDHDQAKNYSHILDGGGVARVFKYETTAPLRFLELTDNVIGQTIADQYGEGHHHDTAMTVIERGFDGWHLRDDEIMIGVPGKLAFVEIM